MAKKGKKPSGGGGFLLVLLLSVAGALGGWNYHRNLVAENSQMSTRPFQGYSDEDLSQLSAAYQSEAEALDRKYKASLAARSGVKDSDGLIMEQVGEFERVQHVGNSIRVATAAAAEREARIREIRDEVAWRREEGQLRLHLKRLTSL